MARTTKRKPIAGNLEAFLEAVTDHATCTFDASKAEQIFRGIFEAGQIAGDIQRGALESIEEADARFDAGLVHRVINGTAY